jgi:serine/threonine protein kinase
MELEFMNEANHLKEKIDDVLVHLIVQQVRSITREEKMKSYINDVLEGLGYIHSRGFIHCDIKLENLFCNKIEGEILRNVKVADLGLIHVIDQATGKAFIEQKCGTISYIAPEVQNGSYVDAKIDIWSLGIVLYKMSCGYKPT